VFPLREKVTVLDLIRKERILYAESALTYCKDESSTHETMKKKKRNS
jgi:hypothetical protein